VAAAPNVPPETIHGTAIAVNGNTAIIQGPSGSGKSDLALRCLTLGASTWLKDPVQLIADDQVSIRRDADRLIASPPQPIAGLIEVRGTGVYRLPHLASGEVCLMVNLVEQDAIVRLPIENETVDMLGIDVPVFKLDPFEVSAPAKLLLRLVHGDTRI
jgi:HPr kinase/phosphorylase